MIFKYIIIIFIFINILIIFKFLINNIFKNIINIKFLIYVNNLLIYIKIKKNIKLIKKYYLIYKVLFYNNIL